MIESFPKMLQTARHDRYALGAFNIGNKDIFEAIISAAEKTGIPGIIAVSVPELDYIKDEFIEYVIKRMTRSEGIFCLHLDHGKSLNEIKRAIALGFNSVMIDASDRPLEENIRITQEVVDYAHKRGVSVEGELGTIGSTASSSCVGGVDANIIFTEPKNAKIYYEATDIDALAVAIGTSHGLYPKGEVPHLRFDILNSIKDIVSVPLVLHGGSGNAESELRQASRNGIAKINISSEIKYEYFTAIREFIKENPQEVRTQAVFRNACIAAENAVITKMKLFYQ